MNILKLNPILVPKIWGGTTLKNKYQFKSDLNNIGELWAISAISGHSNEINGSISDFKSFYENNISRFKIDDEQFPLLVKILDAYDDLSIQVHPNDEYALIHHNSLGKNECWYIMDLINNDEIIYGCLLNNKEELIDAINRQAFNEIIKTIKIKTGDFIDVPVGMIHAIKKGTVLYELQQSSDVTYRLYDYDRLENNEKRPLHLQDSINVIKYNNYPINNSLKIINEFHQQLIENEYFVLEKINIKTNYTTSFRMPFLLITCLQGQGFINDTPISGGESLVVIDYNEDLIKCEGHLEIMVASSKYLSK
ncbi:MAG: type I phosphomannose isomerase catalytic subunit [Bacilli bacterium]